MHKPAIRACSGLKEFSRHARRRLGKHRYPPMDVSFAREEEMVAMVVCVVEGRGRGSLQ